MSEVDASTSLQAGRAALEAGEWESAARALEQVPETAESLELLGTAYFWLDHPETIDVRERAYRAHRAAGDARGAARVAVAVAFDHLTFRGEFAVGQGWLELAGRALVGVPPCVEHARLAAFEADFALTAGDLELAARKAAEAVELARQVADADTELLGLAQQGKLLVSNGRVAEGMRLLDASAAAAVAGEIADRAYAGYACCYVISACTSIRDLARASQWCQRLDEHCARVGFHSLQQFCRLQYAGVLVEQGRWDEAESQLSEAAQILGSRRPGFAGDAVIVLAELRRRQGRFDEAAALFADCEGHPAAVLGEAAIALDRGDARAAVAAASRHLRQTSSADRMWRASGLDLLVRGEAALGQLDRARAALADLEACLAGVGPGLLHAHRLLAEAAVLMADGDPEGARACAEDAVDLFDRAGAPFGSARARAELARVLLAVGDRAGAARVASAAATAFEALGCAQFAAEARSVVAAPAESPLTARELDVLRLVAQGHSNADIAERLVLSEHTVHRHVANVLTKLEVSTRAAAVARAATWL